MAEEKAEEKPDKKLLKKKKKKKARKKTRSMEDFMKPDPRVLRPGKKRLQKPAKKLSKMIPWVIGILGCLAMAWAYQAVMEKKAEKDIGDKYNVSLSALDRVYLGCKSFWSEAGNYDSCPLEVMEKTLGKLMKDVELKVIEGRSHAFKVQAKHKENDKIFQVNKQGEVFLNVNGCLAEVKFLELTPKQVQSLEKQCQ